jgi:hypothetical protein
LAKEALVTDAEYQAELRRLRRLGTVVIVLSALAAVCHLVALVLR